MCIKFLTTKSLLLFTVTLIAFSGCNNKGADSINDFNKRTSIGGDAIYGGNLCVSEEESFRSIFPGKIEDATSAKIASQIHDGLVNFNSKDLTISPSIAKDWSINEDQTENPT